MAITKQQREKADRIINWLEALKTRKKTTSQLGRKNKTTGEWQYCCLGVACRINKLDVNYEVGTEYELVNLLGLRDDIGLLSGLSKNLRLIVPSKNPNSLSYDCSLDRYALIMSNDTAFAKDTTFLRQRRFMLLTLDHWIEDETVARSVKARMLDEIKRIQKMSDRQRGFRLEKA